MSEPRQQGPRRRSRTVVWIAVATVLLAVAALVVVLTRPGLLGGEEQPSGGLVVAAAGDIACDVDGNVDENSCQHEATSDVVLDMDPDVVLALGDLQYPSGGLEDFEESYDPTWGRFKDITRPVPGNHELGKSEGTGYYGYFGETAGERDKGWYSFDAGGWHFVALNSECDDDCLDKDGEQRTWLAEDLAASDAPCTLAFFHRPRFSSDEQHGDSRRVKRVWEQLDEAGVDLVLTAHSHSYERFGPLDADGNADPDGIPSFVVGTGGKSLYDRTEAREHSEAWNNDTFGVLQLNLHESSYDWQFVRAAGGDFEDVGSADCANPGS
ncbi:metallophosphoesterase family protein [Modestobacter sp. URMC 112]